MYAAVTSKKIFQYIFYAFLSAFIIASAFTLAFARQTGSDIFSIQSAPEINVSLLLILTAVFGIDFFLFFFFRKTLYRSTVIFSVLIFALLIFIRTRTQQTFFTTALALAAVALVYAYKEVFPDKEYALFNGIRLYITVGILTAGMTAMLTAGCIARMYDFNASTFDFGIFAQMFESMAADFTQNTTLERGGELSHFAVHFSPVYYLLLPFYMLFRRPEFLLAAQAAVCFSGVIPVMLLCRHWHYGNTKTFLASIVFLCYPAFTCGCFYDFHENVFLVPIILWLMYFIEADKLVGSMAAGILLLCVKEDAGLYLIFAAMYALLNKNIPKITGVLLLIMGVTGFLGVTAFINAYGEGIKVSRYDIFLAPHQNSLTDVIVNVIKNPVCFFDKLLDGNKVIFLIQMLLPLLFLPLKSRRLCDWCLIAPLVIVNLATEYSYQHDIYYQYVFGTGAFLVFLFVKNIRYEKKKTKTVSAAALAAAICLLGYSAHKYANIDQALKHKDWYDSARSVLSELPRDAKILSATYFTPYLYDCREVYMFPSIHGEVENPDYLLLDSRCDQLKNEEAIEEYTAKGYERIDNDSFVIVLRSPEYRG